MVLKDAILLASRATTFARAFEDVLRAGWEVRIARDDERPGVRKGEHVIAVEKISSAFVARLAHQVAFARALAPPLPLADPTARDFARVNAVALLTRDGLARLDAALVRDELLHAGGPDIGGPGLRGEQLHAYEGFRRGIFGREDAARVIGLSSDSALAEGFVPGEGPRIARNLSRAFACTPRGTLPAKVLAFLERAHPDTAAAVLDADVRARPPDAHSVALEAPLAPPDAHSVALEAPLAPPFTRLDVRLPRAPGGPPPRATVVVQSGALAFAAFAARFGLGAAYHVDASEWPLATAAYATAWGFTYVTFAVDGGDVRALTIERPA
jgi:hypothetical protein